MSQQPPITYQQRGEQTKASMVHEWGAFVIGLVLVLTISAMELTGREPTPFLQSLATAATFYFLGTASHIYIPW